MANHISAYLHSGVVTDLGGPLFTALGKVFGSSIPGVDATCDVDVPPLLVSLSVDLVGGCRDSPASILQIFALTPGSLS